MTSGTAKNAAESEQLLTFIVDGQEYGVDILRVQEIRGWSAPMPIPQAPAYIKGVINIRGDVVPIADLRERLGLPTLPYGQTTVVIVLRVLGGARERVMGVIVDAMSDVTNVPTGAVKAPPSFHDSSEPSPARGIAMLEEKMITILDVDRIFGEHVVIR
ncbi:MAG TPA: chemotaxis protein CheW [Polyangiaceae bacterium]|nr:chemotaxis protein CheW [Polyangiaceae bacterium]